MSVLLVYSFLQDMDPFPAQVLNPLAYKTEAFATAEDALRKARYVLSHSRAYHLAIWNLAPVMDDGEIRRWVAGNPDAKLSPASEARSAERGGAPS